MYNTLVVNVRNLHLHNLDKHVCQQSRFVWGNSHRLNAFLDIRFQYFFQVYFQRYENDPSMLDFHPSKPLKILLEIHAQQSTHFWIHINIGKPQQNIVFFDNLREKNTCSFRHLTITYLHLTNCLHASVLYSFIERRRLCHCVRKKKLCCPQTWLDLVPLKCDV